MSPRTLLLALLLHLAARADWVQISQNRYHKHDPQAPYQPDTQPSQQFNKPTQQHHLPNQSQTDKHWKQGSVQRIPHLGTVKRVQVASVHTKNNVKNKNNERVDDKTQTSDDKLTLSMDRLNGFVTENHEITFDAHNVANDNSMPTTSKKPDRKKPTSVKSNPFLTADLGNQISTVIPSEHINDQSNRIPFKNTNRVYVGMDGTQQALNINTSEETIADNVPENPNNHKVIFKRYDIVQHIDLPFITKHKSHHKDDNGEHSITKVIKRIDKHEVEESTKSENGSIGTKENHNHHDKETPAHMTKQRLKPAPSKEESSVNKTNVNTLENVLEFLKDVANTISRNTKKGVESKVKYLQNLKNRILSNIEVRVNALWPEEGGRRARSLSPAARGHVDFPSSESALMTISFLTFAVFLIKLVLQVIHKYKNNTMMVAPAFVATVRRGTQHSYADSAPDPDTYH